jgi:predicted transcriptional regulator
MENSEIVLDALIKAGRPLKGGEIAELSDLDKKIVDRSLKALLATGKVLSPKRCFYEPKK